MVLDCVLGRESGGYEISPQAYRDAHTIRGRRSWKGRWMRSPSVVAGRRVVVALRHHGFPLIMNWRLRYQSVPHVHVGRRRLATSVRWRQEPGGPPMWGLCRMARRRVTSTVRGKGLDAREERRLVWRWDLGEQRRWAPDVWFLCLPPGTVLVVPDSILRPGWRHLELPRFAGCWLWRFEERWDLLRTYPALPEDLVGV
jgi:hypothetical protein